jgi:hypothetical protein
MVPNCCAHQPVSACDWSRPVKNASSSGLRSRTGASHDVAISIASSHPISRNSPLPRSPTRSKGLVSRAGEWCCMIPLAPLAHSTPLFTGCEGFPWM